jgi:hypothetical protein
LPEENASAASSALAASPTLSRTGALFGEPACRRRNRSRSLAIQRTDRDHQRRRAEIPTIAEEACTCHQTDEGANQPNTKPSRHCHRNHAALTVSARFRQPDRHASYIRCVSVVPVIPPIPQCPPKTNVFSGKTMACRRRTNA